VRNIGDFNPNSKKIYQKFEGEALDAYHAGCLHIAQKREEAQTDCVLTRIERVMHAFNEVTLFTYTTKI
jgi:hypothetical protein